MPQLKNILCQWEVSRWPFNAVLLAFGLWWSWPLRSIMKEEAFLGYWGSVLGYGVVANVFYTLGPALEAYLWAFRGQGMGKGRWLVMTAGWLVSLFMTWGFVWSMEILYVVLYPSRR